MPKCVDMTSTLRSINLATPERKEMKREIVDMSERCSHCHTGLPNDILLVVEWCAELPHAQFIQDIEPGGKAKLLHGTQNGRHYLGPRRVPTDSQR